MVRQTLVLTAFITVLAGNTCAAAVKTDPWVTGAKATNDAGILLSLGRAEKASLPGAARLSDDEDVLEYSVTEPIYYAY